MEKGIFWVLLVSALLIGLIMGFSINNAVTGQATWWQKIFGINQPSNLFIRNWTNCSDTDGGLNYILKGNCTDINGTRSDICLTNSTLREWRCTGNTCESVTYNCVSHHYTRCSNGRCINYTAGNYTA